MDDVIETRRLQTALGRVAAVVLVDGDGTTSYVSAAASRLLGPAVALFDKVARESSREPGATDLVAMLASLLTAPARHVMIELRVPAPDGTLRWIEARGTNWLADPEIGALVIELADLATRHAWHGPVHVDELARRKLETILDTLPVGVWIADASGALIQHNPAAAQIWAGRAPVDAHASYATCQASWPATGAPLAAEDWALARTLRSGATIVAEALDIVRFDGTRGHVLNSSAPLLDERGQLVGGVAVVLDVSDAHAAERVRGSLIATLEFERGRLGTLLQKSPAFIAVMRGRDHVFELANEAYVQLVGGREVLGRPLLEALPELAGQGFVELLDNVLATGERFIGANVPVVLARTPGSPLVQRYVTFVYQPLVEADGTRTGVFVHGVDVTDATIAERRLRAQFHAVPVPTTVWHRVERDGQPQFVLVDFNAAAIRLSHGKLTEQLGEPARVFFSDNLTMVGDLERCASTGETIQRELDRTSKETGESQRMFITYAASPPDLVIVHAEDITERRKLEGHLRQAQKMEAVGRLAGGVAHDFNNVLSVILSYTELHLEGLNPRDPLYEDLNEIHKAGLRAAGLTRQLLAFSRQQVLEPCILDLDATLKELDKMLRRLLGEDIQLVLVMDTALRGVFVDPGQIEQVIMNLAVNARDAMPTGGTLTIETTNVDLDADFAARLDAKPGPYVLLAVTDTGIGMDDATRAQIFDPFFTTKGTNGTGLGLATVFGIVHQSGGTIWAESELGRGTTFKVYLPRAQAAARTTPHAMTAATIPLGGTETILLVEDDDAVRTLVRTLLRRAGYTVLDAQNGGEAFLIAEQFASPIQLLLTDVVMPRMSGPQVAERLRPTRADMAVLYMSGYNDDAVVKHGVLESGSAFMQKPVTSEVLLRKVRGVLDQAQRS